MAGFSLRRISPVALLRRASLAYLIVWILSPPLAYGTVWRVFAAAAMGMWLLLELLSSRSVLLRPSRAVLAAIVYIGFTAFVESLVPSPGGFDRHLQIWIMLLFLMVGESFSRGREGDARFVFWCVLLVMPIWMFTTLQGIESIAHDVARTISRSSIEARRLAAQGIGGFGFVYTVVLCLPFLAQAALGASSTKRRGWAAIAGKLLVWVNFLLGSLLVLRAGYSIALLLGASAIVFVLLIRSRRAYPFAISLCLSGLIVLGASLGLEPALDYLQGISAGTEYAAKVHDMQASLNIGSATGTVEGRTERYERSFMLFLDNPLVGALDFEGVGGHSAFLDRFAQYGVFVGLLFFYLLIHWPVTVLRNAAVPIGLALSFFVVALVFPMVNTVFMAWGLVLYAFSRGAMVEMNLPIARRIQQDSRRADAPPGSVAPERSAQLR